jgi:hypothetical protein
VREARRDVPSSVKRQLRQEAGFGCCRCGHPFIEYHHIIPWAEDEHFRPTDMMALCGQCHPLCTVGALTETDQRKLKSRPKNIVDNLLRGHLFVNATELAVNLCGGRMIEVPRLLVVGTETIIGARLDDGDGRVLISALVHDSSGRAIARLQDNEWSMAPGDVWDFDVHALQATVRQGPRDIAFAVDVRNDEINLRGKWFHRGSRIEFTPTEGRLGTNRLSGLSVSHCGIGIAVH